MSPIKLNRVGFTRTAQSVAFSVLLLCTQSVLADNSKDAIEQYPEKPIKFIVPIAAGGSIDTITRSVADKLREKWNNPVTVENMPGGSGLIGMARFLKSDPDGYTFLAHGDTVVLNPLLRKNADYVLEDLVGVNRFTVTPQVLVVNPDFAPRTLKEYVEYAKENPSKIRLALPVQAGIGHLAHAKLETEADIQVTHVPYKGGAPAAVDALGGHVDALIITLPAISEHMKSGKLIPLAVSTPERSSLFPDIPTMAESGYPKAVTESWAGLFAAKDTPKPIVEKLHADITEIMSDPDLVKKAESLGFTVSPMSSLENFNQWLQSEREKHKETIENAKIQLN